MAEVALTQKFKVNCQICILRTGSGIFMTNKITNFDHGFLQLCLSQYLLFSSHTTAIAMSHSPMVILNDDEVSRMMAEKAMHDQAFKNHLLSCVSPDFFACYTRQNRITFRVISETIMGFRVQIVSQAELRAPTLPNGKSQDLNTYLKRVRNSKMLLGKASIQKGVGTEAGDREWGWVVSRREWFEALLCM